MTKQELEIRRGIVEACRSMNALGINQGTAGNVSARFGNVMLITPTGIPYDELNPKDLAAMPIDGEYGSWTGLMAPSSEWRFHLDIMKSRPEVGAIVHTHSIYATAFAICHKPIPAVHYMVAAAGGPDIRVAPYATYGTQELSDHATKALEGRSCCLLGNHGVIATGATVKKALWLAVEIETLAQQYYLALTIGGAQILPEDEIAHVVEKFKNYGPRAKPLKGDKKAAGTVKSAGKSSKKRAALATKKTSRKK